MRLSETGLKSLLQQSVAELGFTRRNEKDGWPNFRRMLCTLDMNLLNSIAGRVAFNYINPVMPPAYNVKAYKLVTVYDLLWQSWRNIPFQLVNVINVLPSHNKKQQDEFWGLFEAQFKKMSSQDKINFMMRS